MKEQKLVEIARSFSYKLNLGEFSNADFFCAGKTEVPEAEAGKKSAELYEFCEREVVKSVVAFLKALKEPTVLKEIREWLKNGEKVPEWNERKQEELEKETKLEELSREQKEVENLKIIEE